MPYKSGDVIHNVSAPPRLRQDCQPCFHAIRTLKIHCIFCGRRMGGQVRLMSRRKQWIGLTIPVVMKNSERAMILLTVALMIPLLCGITFPRWTTCHWGWRTDPSNPLCLKGSFSTVLPDSSDGKLGYYNFALCGRWHIDCGYPMSPLSLLPSSTKCPSSHKCVQHSDNKNNAWPLYWSTATSKWKSSCWLHPYSFSECEKAKIKAKLSLHDEIH